MDVFIITIHLEKINPLHTSYFKTTSYYLFINHSLNSAKERFSRNSETFTSEFLDSPEEMFPLYYMQSNVFMEFKLSITLY